MSGTSTLTATPFALRLDSDWFHLVRRPATASLLKALAARYPGFPHGGADPVVAAVRSGDDELVRQLVATAQKPGEAGQIAARILIEALRPLVVRLARQYTEASGFQDAFEHVTSVLFQVLRTVPLTRRGAMLANVRMEVVGQLFGDRRKHHPAARRAINGAAPRSDLERLHKASSGAPSTVSLELADSAEDLALRSLETDGAFDRAREAGLTAGEQSRERAELFDLLLWALDQRVITPGQARALANHGQPEAQQPGNRAAVNRARERGIHRLREAASRYLAAQAA